VIGAGLLFEVWAFGRRRPSLRASGPVPLIESSCRSSAETVTDQEQLQKNALCDRLMKDGIDGRPDSEAVDRTGALTHLAVELGRKDALACVGAWFESLDQKGVSGKLAIILDYYRANAIAGERYGTEWKWEQPTLAREIFFLRRAVNHPEFTQISVRDRCMCLNNLGNRLRVAGRAIEALAYWNRTLEVEPNFGMAHCNKARILLEYANVLEDREQRTIFYWMAHKEASAALAKTALYTHVHDRVTLKSTKEQKEWLESFLDVDAIAKLDPLASEDTATTDEERGYRRWCRENCLYLNLLNDLGPYPVAEWDTIALPVHMVPDDAPHIFDSFFYQMKQEYVSARWLLYEGVTAKTPHFSDRDVFLAATEPLPALCLAIEKTKTAYRTFYSLFDKIAFLTNTWRCVSRKEMFHLADSGVSTGTNRSVRNLTLRAIGASALCTGSQRISSRGRMTRWPSRRPVASRR